MSLRIEGLTFPLQLRPATPLSDLELERFSEDNRPYRVERNKHGELIIMTPVGTVGGNFEFYISGQLAYWIDEDGTGMGFSPSTGFTLPDGSVVSPDASWISTDRWNELTETQQAGYAHICPAFVIEVRSPSDKRHDVEQKMAHWIENGAQLAWLIDPPDATVTIYRPNQPTETLERPDLVLGHAPVAGFQLKTTRLWKEQ